jgi:hypothetical protein
MPPIAADRKLYLYTIHRDRLYLWLCALSFAAGWLWAAALEWQTHQPQWVAIAIGVGLAGVSFAAIQFMSECSFLYKLTNKD